MARCYNCGKPPMYLIGPKGQQVPLCLDCNLKHTQMLAIQNDQLERMMNYLTEYAESATGVRGVLPRFQQRQVKIIEGGKVGKIILNKMLMHFAPNASFDCPPDPIAYICPCNKGDLDDDACNEAYAFSA